MKISPVEKIAVKGERRIKTQKHNGTSIEVLCRAFETGLIRPREVLHQLQNGNDISIGQGEQSGVISLTQMDSKAIISFIESFSVAEAGIKQLIGTINSYQNIVTPANEEFRDQESA